MADEQGQTGVYKDLETQQMLNKPLSGGLTSDEELFLNKMLALVKEGKIDTLKPSTLVNMAIYEKLSEQVQGHVDFEAVSMLQEVRQIVDLENLGFRNSYQMDYLVQILRQKKDRLESEAGDVFII